MTYREATEYLFTSAPLFQNIGAGAYKEGLSNTHTLDEHFGHPHRAYHTIHIGGTNGKGSCSHTIAAILMAAGYRVGLYTSPHLVDFRERIRVNGTMIPEQRVVDFIEKERAFFEPLHPSFFELTTALAFTYFKEENVDFAVIEVGLGGRLDCTNIIQPDISVITNISFDHTQFLGNTLEQIAREKAGIIKQDTPIIIGEIKDDDDVRHVFQQHAASKQATITFASDKPFIISSKSKGFGREYQLADGKTIYGQLGGDCQENNTNTILHTAYVLQRMGVVIQQEHIEEAFAHVCDMTGLMGRWQQIGVHPITICDTGHNVGGWEYISRQLAKVHRNDLHIIIGMVKDKDVRAVISMLPKDAKYYFTQASVKRAMPAEDFAALARATGLFGEIYPDVAQAYKAARYQATDDDLIFVGGSSFIVADLLSTDGLLR